MMYVNLPDLKKMQKDLEDFLKRDSKAPNTDI